MAQRIDFDAPENADPDPFGPMPVRIDSAWRIYREGVLPGSMPPAQLDAAREVFYGGFGACLYFMNRLAEPDVDGPARAETIGGLVDELAEFQSRNRKA